jgi:Spy/CpxP family protein refolding chaperone
MRHELRHLLIIPALLLLIAPGAVAQEEPQPPPEAAPEGEELRRAIRNHFTNGLRAELGLTDEQAEALRPLIDEIENSRAQVRRDRGATVRSLNRGLRQGASDDELQGLLDRLESIDEEQRAFEKSVQTRIDRHLTVRQRVQFRFFAERFRRKLERRIEDLQRERRGGPGRDGYRPRGEGPSPRWD